MKTALLLKYEKNSVQGNDFYLLNHLKTLKTDLIHTLQNLYNKLVQYPSFKYMFVQGRNSNVLIKEELVFNGVMHEDVIKTLNHKFLQTHTARMLDQFVVYNTPYVLPQYHKYFCDTLNKLEYSLERITLKAERYLLALESLENRINQNHKPAVIDLDLVISRLQAIRNNITFGIRIANKKFAGKIFKEKVLSLKQAQQLYTDNEIERNEVILAGGDGTRYLGFLYALWNLPDTIDYVTDDVFYALSKYKKYQDIAHIINQKTLNIIIETPLFSSCGISAGQIKKNYAGYFDLRSIKAAIGIILNKFNPEMIPKAMNYGFELKFKEKNLYINFFLSAFIRTVNELIKNDKKKHTLFYIVRNKKHATALEMIVKKLQVENIISLKNIDLKFISGIRDSIAIESETTFFLFDEDNKLKTTSTGHGPAFIRAVKDIYEEMKVTKDNPLTFSIRTMDNIGTDLCYFTGLTQRAAQQENELRNKLVKALREKNKLAIRQIIKTVQKQFYSKRFLMNEVVEFINIHWDFQIQDHAYLSFKDIAEIIDEKPITVAVVLADHHSVGGGLYVNTDGQMVVIDKYVQLNKVKSTLTQFNPMLYSMLIKRPLTKDDENQIIYIVQKNKKGKAILQGESAATHIATNPDNVLKRVISLTKNDIENIDVVFKDQKTLNQTHKENTVSMQNKLIADIKAIAVKSKRPLNEIIDRINGAQEDALRYLNEDANTIYKGDIKVIDQSWFVKSFIEASPVSI